MSDEKFPQKSVAKVDVDEGDLEWFRYFIGKRKWLQGKADPSREYPIRGWISDDDSGSEWAAVILRDLGKPAKYFSETHVYLHVDRFK